MNRREFVVAGLGLPFVVDTLGEGSRVDQSNVTSGREIMWRRVDELSLEQARILETEMGYEISGTVLITEQGAPLRVDYSLLCDTLWRTRTVYVEQAWRGARRTMVLKHDGNGHWQENSVEKSALAGCSDVDLGITPSTNALPVNRLRLPTGGKKEISVAWVRFPEFDVVPARQMYTRVGENQYLYKSLASGFTARIDVDASGLPTEYAGVWSKVAEGAVTPVSPSTRFAQALVSFGPSPELGEAAKAFGWLIGGWAAEIRDFDSDGRARYGKGEWWFSWVLEGRAVQDVWISPPRPQRLTGHSNSEESSLADNRYGTTVRWFDSMEGLWRIVWINPVSGAFNQLAGRKDGDRMVLSGEADGRRIRWSFNDIRPDSFIWRGEFSDENGQWNLGAEFRLRKIL